jgi:hypothetical protein
VQRINGRRKRRADWEEGGARRSLDGGPMLLLRDEEDSWEAVDERASLVFLRMGQHAFLPPDSHRMAANGLPVVAKRDLPACASPFLKRPAAIISFSWALCFRGCCNLAIIDVEWVMVGVIR